MPDEWDQHAAFERELEQLGPIMARQEQVEAQEPDAEFLRSLRARLVGNLEPPPPVRPAPLMERLREELRRRWPVVGGLSLAGAAAAIILALVLGGRSAGRPGARPVAFQVPTPSRQEIVRSYPLSGGIGAGGGAPPPWVDTLALPPGAPYASRLHLTARSLPGGVSRAAAYRLRGPGFNASRIRSIARALGITSPVRRTTQGGVPWVYAADRAGVTQIHSVAVSLQTGQLIYHDTRVPATPVRPGAPPSPADVAAARRWLSSLGWPGSEMVLHLPASPQERDLSWVVRLDWPGASPADTPGATLSVGKNGEVMEADLLPPIGARGTVSTQSYASAWAEVRQGTVPLAVENMIGRPPNPGTGSLRRVSLIYLLTQSRSGRLYLVPAYRFSGEVSINEVAGQRTWYAIVPALSR